MKQPFRLLDLFSGIGGFSLGLERSGAFKTVAFCEIDPFCRKVLAKHWPEVPQYDDIRTLTADRLAADGIAVDAIAGGFPCQDLSYAGKGAGLAGERSGLWREYARLIGEIRPRYVIVENVAALLGRGLGDVLADLAALGFAAEWHCIPASAVGAPHRRDRVWIIAHARGEQHEGRCDALGRASAPRFSEAALADAAGQRELQSEGLERDKRRRVDDCGAYVSYPVSERGRGGDSFWKHAAHVGEPSRHSLIGNWNAEPNVGRVAHGVPARVDRLRGLGNAVVPQIPELIGRAIAQAEGMTA
jgi:DNA (cytosine-5)-methyltransferase 1